MSVSKMLNFPVPSLDFTEVCDISIYGFLPKFQSCLIESYYRDVFPTLNCYSLLCCFPKLSGSPNHQMADSSQVYGSFT